MRLITVALAAVGLVLLDCADGAGQSTDSAAAAAARSRQGCIRTIQMEYKQIDTIMRGGIIQADSPPPYKTLAPVPAKETTLESVNRLIMDGEKLRSEDNHPVWNLTKAEFVTPHEVRVFNGSEGKEFNPNGGVNGTLAQGTLLGASDALAYLKSPVLTPIAVTLRGLDPNISPYRLGEMKPSGVKFPIDGASCEEYVIDYRNGLTVSCWFDSTKDYALRRIRKQKEGHLVEQTDITSYQHDACGWVPTAWVNNEYTSGGGVLRTRKVQVVDLRLNASQAARQFELEFPPGTIVQETKEPKAYRVQTDGSMREVSLRNFEDLPGIVPQPGMAWYRQHKWLIASLGIILTVAALSYIVRRLRRRAA